MPSPLETLEPRPIWQHFDAIRRIPRPSRHEERIADHVRSWAAEHGFKVREDARGNMVVAVPASVGRENAPVAVLQGHLDMVCEKKAGVSHDFMSEGIEVEVDGDWVKAKGTTLGADNGLGVAAAMAVAVDDEVAHGPLELLLTLDEETGLHGASALDPAIVSGGILINLDTEEDDAVYIGCAGSAGVEGHFSIEREGSGVDELCQLAIRGLRGGHSGIDIIENRGNAIKVAARVLTVALERNVDFALMSFDGGSKRNAIARECFVHLTAAPTERARLGEIAAEIQAEFAAELGAVEPDLEITFLPEGEGAPGWEPMSSGDRDRVLHLLAAAPHGVLTMSREVPGLVETSCNLALATTSESGVRILYSVRSSVNAAATGSLRALRSLFRLAGGVIEDDPGYPGWKPDPDSAVVRRTIAVYEKLFGERPHVKAVHAGLECGILVEKVPGLDAVSIGPEIRNAHSPDEKARISSSAKFYALLKELLADLSS